MRGREGFSLIELIIALVLLTVVLVGIQSATSRYLRTVMAGDRHAIAAEIAKDRIEEIRIDPNYDGLVARYQETRTPIFDPPEFTRDTRLVMMRDSKDSSGGSSSGGGKNKGKGKSNSGSSSGSTGDGAEYIRITVTVNGAGLTKPVERTISLARP